MATVVLKDVHKYYGKVHAVKGINFRCEDGEFLALLGPSGCGKSTTMRMIAGLEEISSGEIYLGDRLINNLSPKERDIAMVFENYALYPHMTVFDNIAFPLYMRKTPQEEIKKKVHEVAKLLAVDNVLQEYPPNLSDGQKQRIGIGRAIVRNPNLFLFDEPISHLDNMLRQQMRKEIRRLQKNLGATMIYVTHDQLEALSMADRIAVMNEGELQQLGTRDEILDQPANTFVAQFVGEPPINFLKAQFKREAGQLKLFLPELAVSGNKATIDLHESRSKQAAELSPDSELTIGIRPLDIKAYNTEVPGGIPGKIFFVEFLDEFNILTVQIEEKKLLVEAPKDLHVRLDDPVWLKFNELKVHFFDAEHGKNVLKKAS